jgi:hypothetical protein
VRGKKRAQTVNGIPGIEFKGIGAVVVFQSENPLHSGIDQAIQVQLYFWVIDYFASFDSKNSEFTKIKKELPLSTNVEKAFS